MKGAPVAYRAGRYYLALMSEDDHFMETPAGDQVIAYGMDLQPVSTAKVSARAAPGQSEHSSGRQAFRRWTARWTKFSDG